MLTLPQGWYYWRVLILAILGLTGFGVWQALNVAILGITDKISATYS